MKVSYKSLKRVTKKTTNWNIFLLDCIKMICNVNQQTQTHAHDDVTLTQPIRCTQTTYTIEQKYNNMAAETVCVVFFSIRSSSSSFVHFCVCFSVYIGKSKNRLFDNDASPLRHTFKQACGSFITSPSIVWSM